jgi:hypothetical protein
MSVAAPPIRAQEREGLVTGPVGVETQLEPERPLEPDTLPESELGGFSMLLISAAGALAVTTVVAFIAEGAEWMAALGIATALLGVIALMLVFVRLVRPDDDDEASSP